MAVVVLLWSGVGFVFLGLGMVVIMGSLYSEMRLALRLTPNSVMALTRLNDQLWQIHFLRQAPMSVGVLPSSLISRYFLLLQVSSEKADRQNILIFWDSLPKPLLRQLRVALRLSASYDSFI